MDLVKVRDSQGPVGEYYRTDEGRLIRRDVVDQARLMTLLGRCSGCAREGILVRVDSWRHLCPACAAVTA